MRLSIRPSGPLVQRESATREGIAGLAKSENATHAMAVGEHMLIFYRSEAGGFECATAFHDGSSWELSGWAHRSVPSLPSSAWALD